VKDEESMDMQVTAIAPNAARVVLVGRLDMAGSAQIDLAFNAAAGANRNIIVDMSAVTFVASIGIRTLVIGAKTVQRRGGKLLLLNPQADVEQVLETIGVTDLLPIMRDEAEAMAAIRS
jgi:anti-sigma B factor antagonist